MATKGTSGVEAGKQGGKDKSSWVSRVTIWWGTRENRWEDGILARLPANEQDEDLRQWISKKRRLRRSMSEVESCRANSESLRTKLSEIDEQIGALPAGPTSPREYRRINDLKRERESTEKELNREEQKLERLSKSVDEQARDLRSYGSRNIVGRSAHAFRVQFAAASGVFATLTVGAVGLLATSTGAGSWTPVHVNTLSLAVAGIGAGLVFHGIPLGLHFLDWRLGISGRVHQTRGSHVAGRDRQIVAFQGFLLALQVILWSLVMIRIFGHLTT